MADENDQLTRREAIKTIGAGVGVIATLPVLGGSADAQELAAHEHSHNTGQATAPAKAQPLKFFTEEENKTVVEMSERIIPADEHSPGAKAAGVSQYIDLVISEVDRRHQTDVARRTGRDQHDEPRQIRQTLRRLDSRSTDRTVKRDQQEREVASNGRRKILPNHQVRDGGRLLHVRDRHTQRASLQRQRVPERVHRLHASRASAIRKRLFASGPERLRAQCTFEPVSVNRTSGKHNVLSRAYRS